MSARLLLTPLFAWLAQGGSGAFLILRESGVTDSGSQRRTGSERLGAKISTKEFERAAAEGRMVTLRRNESIERRGYVAGMDDYHWRLVDTSGAVMLCHKALWPEVYFSSQPTLDDEPEDVRNRIIEVSQSFRRRCAEKLGKHL